MDRGALKLIGDEGIVRGAALQSQVGIAGDDRDVDIPSTGQHTDRAVAHGNFGIEFRCGQMVNATAAHGKIEIRILHSQAVGRDAPHGKFQIQFFHRERAKVNVAHGKINVYLMQDIFRSRNGEHSTVNIRGSVVFRDMVGKLCGSVFFVGMGEVPGSKAIKL